jgi:hypothetical protein
MLEIHVAWVEPRCHEDPTSVALGVPSREQPEKVEELEILDIETVTQVSKRPKGSMKPQHSSSRGPAHTG